MKLKELSKRLRIALRALRLPGEFDYVKPLQREIEHYRRLIRSISLFPLPTKEQPKFKDMPESFLPDSFMEYLRKDFTGEPMSIVDVGAQNLDMEEHIYTPLRKVFPCQIYGFEPLPDDCAIRSESEPDVTMLGAAVGSGEEAVLNVTSFSPGSSLYTPNFYFLDRFHGLPHMLRVEQQIKMPTKRLDDFEEIEDCDFLKIDIQGGELDALKGGTELLKSVMAIYIEVEFSSVYERQPLFPEVHAFLTEQGFEFMDFLDPGYASFRAGHNGNLKSQLLWANALYFRKLEDMQAVMPTKVLKAIAVAHFNFQKYDYTAQLLRIYDDRMGTDFAHGYSYATQYMGHATKA